jgi:Asp/Glu/hydantoin racemase
MRILLVNPNTSEGVTRRIAGAAEAAAAPGTEIVCKTAPYGVPYIASRAEAVIGARVALEMLAEHAEGMDAAVVAAFADPGLGGARELLDIPVIGLAEAAMLTACMLGRRFAIVSFSPSLGPWYRECVEYHGLVGRMAAIRLLDAAFARIDTVQDELEAGLVEIAGRAVAENEADTIILAGAPLAGLAARVADRIPVPVIDGIAAAVKQAEALAALKPLKARAGTFRRPPPKPVTGVTSGLARLIERKDGT